MGEGAPHVDPNQAIALERRLAAAFPGCRVMGGSRARGVLADGAEVALLLADGWVVSSSPERTWRGSAEHFSSRDASPGALRYGA
jgi:hypothetical protein